MSTPVPSSRVLQLLVKLVTGKRVTVHVSLGTGTVDDLKAAIESVTRIASREQRLLVGETNTQLNESDCRSLASYGLKEGSVVLQLIRFGSNGCDFTSCRGPEFLEQQRPLLEEDGAVLEALAREKAELLPLIDDGAAALLAWAAPARPAPGGPGDGAVTVFGGAGSAGGATAAGGGVTAAVGDLADNPYL